MQNRIIYMEQQLPFYALKQENRISKMRVITNLLCDDKAVGKIARIKGEPAHTLYRDEVVYTVYGDYFFVQALQQVLYDTESCW